MVVEGREEKCPRFHQIRQVSFFNIAASGPAGARALTRKVVGNEEYCLQIDAHTDFVPQWDALAKADWKKIGNEFAIISTVPASKADMPDYENWTGGKNGEVPRQCLVRIADNDIPEFPSPTEGKATGLETPLLSHAWSAAFSFSKCHIEETAPYDPFTQYVFGAEQFSRFARFWTRGYDVYTPTKNIVYHDYTNNGHDIKEWFKQRRERVRKQGLLRTKTFLGIEGPEGVSMEVAHANLGIYGLGKRRSLKQLQDFVGIDLTKRQGNKGTSCAVMSWVPYDASVSPIEHLYDKATDLDPQPEFTLRSEFNFYIESEPEEDKFMVIDADPIQEQDALPVANTTVTAGGSPPFMMLLMLWIFGLIVWCMVFVNNGSSSRPGKKRAFKKKAGGVKDV